MLNRGFTADGEIDLTNARIGEELGLQGATLTNPHGRALTADRLRTGGPVLCTDGFNAHGQVSMAGAKIGGSLDFAGALLGDPANNTVDLQDMTAAAFMARWAAPPDLVDLRHASVALLADEPTSWPEHLNLDGLTYGDLTDLPAHKRKNWLNRSVPYSPQPYEQLAAHYRRLGHDDEARRVLLAKLRRRRRQRPWWTRWWGWLQDALAGYGYADYTTYLDQREVVNRIAVELIEEHQLLAGRVEIGQSTRMSTSNPNLIGAKTVADIVRAVHLGAKGRIGRRVYDEMARNERAALLAVRHFLDLLLAAFDDLRAVAEGRLEPVELRKQSMLGSATMLRVLAAVYHDLTRVPEKPGGPAPLTRSDIHAFFKSLEPHMKEIPVQATDEFWMNTGAFLPETSAPQARRQSVVQLAEELVRRGREMAASET